MPAEEPVAPGIRPPELEARRRDEVLAADLKGVADPVKAFDGRKSEITNPKFETNPNHQNVPNNTAELCV